MKTKILLLAVTLFTVAMTGCKKSDENRFDYPIENLYGTWNATDIYVDLEWIDIRNEPSLAFAIKFNSNDTYYGYGFFGDGEGTYKAIGNTIYTYISGEEYARYVIQSLNKNNAELTMYMSNSNLRFKATKK